jgi:hypothetical protein
MQKSSTYPFATRMFVPEFCVRLTLTLGFANRLKEAASRRVAL